MSGNTIKFNPREHLRQIERRQRQPDGSYQKTSNDYLDVKWRIVWFREENPEGSIQTDLLSQPGISPAVVQATVTLKNGVTATGFGQCGAEDWGDWLEKAETRSIGRALALLGYGTQFCEDFDDIITDAPVKPRKQRQKGTSGDRPVAADPGSPITPNQRRYIESLARDTGMDQAELDQMVEERYSRPIDEISRADASALIDALQAVKDEQTLASVH